MAGTGGQTDIPSSQVAPPDRIVSFPEPSCPEESSLGASGSSDRMVAGHFYLIDQASGQEHEALGERYQTLSQNRTSILGKKMKKDHRPPGRLIALWEPCQSKPNSLIVETDVQGLKLVIGIGEWPRRPLVQTSK
jgi:hypothetical protein